MVHTFCYYIFFVLQAPAFILNLLFFFPQVYHVLKLGQGQDITAFALNKDNTNLLVATADKQLIIFTDPAVS